MWCIVRCLTLLHADPLTARADDNPRRAIHAGMDAEANAKGAAPIALVLDRFHPLMPEH
jgi:hypothetical protein